MGYKTAKQLGILPEEHNAFIAFIDAPALGRTVSVNGHAHYYDQSEVQDADKAEKNECGTAGCVAGFVFAHARYVQKKRTLRGAKTAAIYIEKASGITCEGNDQYTPPSAWNQDLGQAPILHELYGQGGDWKLAETRKVVDRMLRTGKVVWPEQ